MRAYPVAVRQSLLDAVDAGMSKSDVARRFDVGLATIKRYAAQRREQGHLVPKRPTGRPPLILPAQHGALLALVVSQPGAPLEQYCRCWQAGGGRQVSRSTMSRTLYRLGLRRRPAAPRRRP
jgi:transposase